MTSGPPSGPAARRHRLGARLRQLRQDRAMRLEHVAAELGVVPSTLSRIETGKAPVRAGYLRILLDLYEVSDPGERRVLAALASDGRREDWCAGAAGLLPPETIRYLSLEPAAASIAVFASRVIPGLLQTPDYAIAAWRAARPGITPSQASRLADLTIARQKDPAAGRLLHVVLDEAVLLRPPGTAAVMAAQLGHLASAGTAARATVQVLPLAAPWPVLAPPFTILGFADPADPDLACTADASGHPALTTDPAAIRDHRAAFTALARAALPPGPSARLIAGAASPELER